MEATQSDNSDGMTQVTSAMMDMELPGGGSSDNNNDATTTASREAPPAPRRPLEAVLQAGPPADPIPFPRPLFERGRRDDVLCYNEQRQTHDVARGVLFRDFSREYGDPDGALGRVKEAYWPLPYKEKIKTIMGHVEICLLLKRCTSDSDDSLSDESSNDDSSNAGEDEDIVFEMTSQYVAVKVNYCDRMDAMRNKHAEDPLKEIAAMQLIGNSHPNVMGAIDVLFDGANLNVVMPFCGNGDLFQILQDSQQQEVPGLPEGRARFYFRQILAGMVHLHGKGICHRDLSPENVMIDNNGCLIIDMGMCIRIPYSDPKNPAQVTDIQNGTQKRLIRPQGACGKLPYMSPEIYRNRAPFDGGAVDIWTAGTILFCMVTGNRSYGRPHATDPQFYWMTHGLERLVADWNIHISNECLHLMQNMLRIDPMERLTLEECVNHPWFRFEDEEPM